MGSSTDRQIREILSPSIRPCQLFSRLHEMLKCGLTSPNCPASKKNQKIVLFCQSGNRSKKALELFIEKGFTNVYHLQNGIQSLHNEKL